MTLNMYVFKMLSRSQMRDGCCTFAIIFMFMCILLVAYDIKEFAKTHAIPVPAATEAEKLASSSSRAKQIKSNADSGAPAAKGNEYRAP